MTASLIYVLAIFIAIFHVAPSIVTEKHVSAFIKSYIERKLEADLSFDQVNFSVIGGPSLNLGNVLVSKNGKPLLSVKQARGSLSVLNALTGTLSLDDLTVVSPVVRVVRLADGSYNVPLLNKLDPSKKLTVHELIKGFLDMFKSVSVTNGSIHWKDYHIDKEPVAAALAKVNVSMSREGRHGGGKIDVSGLIQTGGVPASVLLSGVMEDIPDGPGRLTGFSGKVSLTNFNAGRFWPYIRPHVPFQKMNATVSWNATLAGNIEKGIKSRGRVSISGVDIRYAQAFSANVKPRQTVIVYDVEGTNKKFNLKKAAVTIGGLSANVRGTIEGMDTDNPSLDISVDTAPMEVAELREWLPDNALSPQQSSFLSANLKKGEIRLAGLSFKGDFATFENMGTPESLRRFSGSMLVSGARIEFPKLANAFDGIEGKVTLDGDKLAVSGVRGNYGKSALADVSGTLENIHGWPTFNLRANAAVNLDEAEKIIESRAESEELKDFLAHTVFTEGSAGVDMAVTGDTKDLAKSIAMKGKITLDNVTMESEAVGPPVKGLSGEIEGNLKEIKLKRLRWKIGSSPFIVSGTVKDALKDNPYFDMNLTGRAAFEDMNRIRFIATQRTYHQTGEANVSIAAKGGFNDISLSSTLDMTGAHYRLLDVIEKPQGTRNVYTFTGSVTGREKLNIDRLLVDIGESRIVVTGKIGQLPQGQGMDLSFETDGAMLDDLDRYFLFFDDVKGSGLVTGKLGIYSVAGDKPVKLAGGLRVENASFKLPILEGIFNGCNGEFEFLANKFFLKNGSGKFNKAGFTISAQGIVAKRPEFILNIAANGLNLYDLFGEPSGEGEPAPKTAPPPLTDATPTPDWIWTINTASSAGTIGMIHYTDLSARMRYEREVFKVEPLMFSAHGGQWRWTSDIAIPSGKPGISFTSSAQINDLDSGRFLQEAFGHEKIIDSRINLKGDIAGGGERWQDIKKSFSGWVEAKSGPGVIKRFDLLSKIFSLLNVLQYFKLKWPDMAAEGMPYHGIMADFAVKSGVATTKGLMVESDAMRISAVGDYDIGRNTVDLQVGVMPLVTVDKVISSIPLAGYVLTGEKKGFLAAYFEVTGPLGDPEVEAIPFESLASGIANVFKRLFELPMEAVRALEGSNGKR
ncbi:MAG: AsmA-like C-terminal domain-containing protein [Nitrospinae bacterium]|nr:AsmA-like C-terminal domain-containing protein [Nitrospinota bacterium]